MVFDGQLDVPMTGMLEQKLEKSRFVRVDSDVVDRLIVKEDAKKTELPQEDTDKLSAVFQSMMPKMDKANFCVEVQALGEESQPMVVTQSEYMRRMKEMSRFQPGMSFYGEMPDSYSMVLNSDHPLVKRVLDDCKANTTEALAPVLSEIKGQEARLAALHAAEKDVKPEDLTQEHKDDVANTEKALNEQKDKKQTILNNYAKGNSIVSQLIDLALLQNGMLKGAALDKFLKRSVELIG